MRSAGSVGAHFDLTAVGALLVSLRPSATAAVATTGLQSATIVAGDTGGTAGRRRSTGTKETGTKFHSATVAGGIATAFLSVLTAGSYSADPTDLNAEQVTGSTLALNMTLILTFNAITTADASATGTVGWGKMTTSGGTGIADLDVSASGFGGSVQLNTVSIASAAQSFVPQRFCRGMMMSARPYAR